MITEIPETSQPVRKRLSTWQLAIAFFLGALCFLITQVFTRVPLLSWLQAEPGFMLWAMSYPLISGMLIALTAGIFEESGRFAFKAVALKPARTRISEPVIFGLGHGLCEAVWMFSMFWGSISILGFPILIVPVFERLLAITLHVGFSVLIWNGFQLNKRLHYLLLAILAHGMVDALIPLAGKLGLGVLALEGIVAVFAGLLLIYVFYSRKHYEKEVYYEKDQFLPIP
jgi:uncharacterized membrane protein YhfC